MEYGAHMPVAQTASPFLYYTPDNNVGQHGHFTPHPQHNEPALYPATYHVPQGHLYPTQPFSYADTLMTPVASPQAMYQNFPNQSFSGLAPQDKMHCYPQPHRLAPVETPGYRQRSLRPITPCPTPDLCTSPGTFGSPTPDPTPPPPARTSPAVVQSQDEGLHTFELEPEVDLLAEIRKTQERKMGLKLDCEGDVGSGTLFTLGRADTPPMTPMSVGPPPKENLAFSGWTGEDFENSPEFSPRLPSSESSQLDCIDPRKLSNSNNIENNTVDFTPEPTPFLWYPDAPLRSTELEHFGAMDIEHPQMPSKRQRTSLFSPGIDLWEASPTPSRRESFSFPPYDREAYAQDPNYVNPDIAAREITAREGAAPISTFAPRQNDCSSQSPDTQNADSQRAESENADSKNTDSKNADSHNADAHNADSHNADNSQSGASGQQPAADTNQTAPVQKARRGRKQSLTDDPSKQFKCDKCNRGFRRAEHLKRHDRSLHTGDKPFACHCGKRFSRSDNLAQHMRTHGSQIPQQTVQPHPSGAAMGYPGDFSNPEQAGEALFNAANNVSSSSSAASTPEPSPKNKQHKRKRND